MLLLLSTCDLFLLWLLTVHGIINTNADIEQGYRTNCLHLCCKCLLSFLLAHCVYPASVYSLSTMVWCIGHAAVIRELIVSRAGHFTCPVQCGAVLMGQCPTPQQPPSCSSREDAIAGTSPATACDEPAVGVSGISDLQQRRTGGDSTSRNAECTTRGKGSTNAPPGLESLVSLPRDPYVEALSHATDADAIRSASKSGALPPIGNLTRLPGGNQFIEFAPLDEHERAARHAKGWHCRPVVWFR